MNTFVCNEIRNASGFWALDNRRTAFAAHGVYGGSWDGFGMRYQVTGYLENETKCVDNQDRHAGDEADMPGHAVAAALHFAELSGGRTSSESDQGECHSEDGEEKQH